MNGKSNKNVTVTREWLAARGYTIRQAADDVGVSPQHLAYVCRGERKPSRALVERLKALPKYHPVKLPAY